ncbi:MAG TPA: hypothetical protein VI756_00905, partial [Blastocatellia bacterium]
MLDLIYDDQYLAEIDVHPSGDLTEAKYETILDEVGSLGGFTNGYGIVVSSRGSSYEVGCPDL